ncbi:1255_t:CDS:2 [Rhizophagus irregularis]|nr:1255_t:CDS:2 [Rhizophagus irregularis]
MTSTTLTSSSTLSQRTSMSSFELTQEVLEAARDSLLEQETQIILAENISLEGFLKVFLDYIENEQDLPVKIRLVDGKVTAYEVALTPHAVVASYIYFVADATIRPWNVPNSPPVRACNSSGYEYPTMVVEVGLIQSIRANVTGKLKDGNSDLQPLYLLEFWAYNYLQRPTLVTGNVTGSPPCIGLNLPNYILNIPANALFHGAPGGVPNGMAGGINIDLWQIQNIILHL